MKTITRENSLTAALLVVIRVETIENENRFKLNEIDL